MPLWAHSDTGSVWSVVSSARLLITQLYPLQLLDLIRLSFRSLLYLCQKYLIWIRGQTCIFHILLGHKSAHALVGGYSSSDTVERTLFATNNSCSLWSPSRLRKSLALHPLSQPHRKLRQHNLTLSLWTLWYWHIAEIIAREALWSGRVELKSQYMLRMIILFLDVGSSNIPFVFSLFTFMFFPALYGSNWWFYSAQWFKKFLKAIK